MNSKKNYIPLDNTDQEIQYFLDKDSVDIKSNKEVVFSKEQKSEYSLAAKIDFDGIKYPTLKLGEDTPKWIGLEKNEEVEMTYTLSGKVPQDFDLGATPTMDIVIELVPGEESQEQAVEYLQFYDLKRVQPITLVKKLED